MDSTHTERDNEIIGENTPRFHIEHWIAPSRLHEDIKAFVKRGDFDGITNVTAIGLFSSKYGIFVNPSPSIRTVEVSGNCSDIFYEKEKFYDVPEDIKELDRLNGKRSPDYYTHTDRLDNITVREAKEVLQYVLDKSNGEKIEPIDAEEMYNFIRDIRYGYTNSSGKSR